MPTPDNEFLNLVRSQFPTPASLANGSALTLEEAEEIFAGKDPSVVELGFLAAKLKKFSGINWSIEELDDICDRVYRSTEE